ncbi:MAG TPA: hypothetical protein VI142_07430 [Gaiellaceae bacterium]
MIVHGSIGVLWGGAVGVLVYLACRAFVELRVAKNERLAKAGQGAEAGSDSDAPEAGAV